MKPNVFKAILLALLSILCFRLVSTVIALVIELILSIPVIGTIIHWFFRIGDILSGEEVDVNWLVIVLSAIFAVVVVEAMLKKICKSSATIELSEIIAVSLFAFLNIVYLIINASNHDSCHANICYLFLCTIGFISFKHDKDKRKIAEAKARKPVEVVPETSDDDVLPF